MIIYNKFEFIEKKVKEIKIENSAIKEISNGSGLKKDMFVSILHNSIGVINVIFDYLQHNRSLGCIFIE